MAKKQFKTESKRILDLMVGSIYTNREIFLREIISNASDAIDKLCYISLTDDKLGLSRDDFKIELKVDREKRILTVSDNGIGMTAEDLESNLGVIARSGSLKFKTELKEDVNDEAKASSADIDIIGQFGVGFYSAFMVAKKVTVLSKAYGHDTANKWESTGSDGYTIKAAERDGYGTDIIMELKDDSDEDSYGEYLQEYTLHSLIKKYSDYIRWPIIMEVTKSRKVEGEPGEDGKPVTTWEDYSELQTINSRVPLWQRPKSEITDELSNAFFREQFFADSDPTSTIIVAAEGAAVSYKAMLFIPSKVPFDYYTNDYEPGLRLYASGVLIMEKCSDLLPDYFRFVRGVVDSSDLSLNISREMLQQDRQLKTISVNLEKKVRAELTRLQENEPEKYAEFFKAFGLQLKYGILAEYGLNKDKLQDLLMFFSPQQEKLITLSSYIAGMPESQKYIYYACGTDASALDKLPQAEKLRDRGFDTLYMTDSIDEFVVRALGTFSEKEFRSVTSDDLDLLSEDETKQAEKLREENGGLLEFVVESLSGKLTEATLSSKLVSAPVCLTTKGGVTLEMERYFNAIRATEGQEPIKAERVLELNASHAAFEKLKSAFETDKDRAAKYAELLYYESVVMAGLAPEDPVRFCELISELTV